MAKNSSPSRAPKDGAQRHCALTEREKCRIYQNERQLRDLHSFLHSEPPGVCCCTQTVKNSRVYIDGHVDVHASAMYSTTDACEP